MRDGYYLGRWSPKLEEYLPYFGDRDTLPKMIRQARLFSKSHPEQQITLQRCGKNENNLPTDDVELLFVLQNGKKIPNEKFLGTSTGRS